MKSSSGELKYPLLAEVVKAALSLSHGNADVERSFSKSKRVLTEDKAQMSERTLDAKLTVIDALKSYNNRAALVTITGDFITRAYGAHNSYMNYLEAEKNKKIKEDAMAAETLEQLHLQEISRQAVSSSVKKIKEEKIASDVRKEKLGQQKSANEFLAEANMRLKMAIDQSDINAIPIAQGLLEGANVLLANERKKDKQLAKLTLNLKRQHLRTALRQAVGLCDL